MAKRRAILMAIAGAAIMLSAPASAVGAPTDTAVKAAFLPRFARYVTWPSAAIPKGSDPFVLCVIGSDPFGATLDEAARSQSIDGRRIVIRRLNNAAAANDCQIAFAAGRSAQLLASLEGKPVLTVTDGANGAARGIINFAIVGGRVRFYIDQAAAARRGMNVSSRLLALAIGVKQ
jgi:hypothetical protein